MAAWAIAPVPAMRPETSRPARKSQTRRNSTEPHISPYPAASPVMQIINVRRRPSESDRSPSSDAPKNIPTGNSENASDRSMSRQAAE